MKPLLPSLLTLSLLLLTFPLFGQETGVLYQYETSSGLIFKSFGDGKVQPKYKGEIKNEKPNGFGFQTYKNGNKYFGEHKNGLPNCKGTETSPDGWRYVGKYNEGKKHGQGKFTYTDGGWYDGSWKEGQSWTGITYDKDGNISYEKVNGEIQYKQ